MSKLPKDYYNSAIRHIFQYDWYVYGLYILVHLENLIFFWGLKKIVTFQKILYGGTSRFDNVIKYLRIILMRQYSKRLVYFEYQRSRKKNYFEYMNLNLLWVNSILITSILISFSSYKTFTTQKLFITTLLEIYFVTKGF